MLFPIGDDNSDRHRTPFVNYALIIINILVFIFLQGMGEDIGFTYGYSTVPAEILSGSDIVTEASVVEDAVGNRFVLPGLEPSPQPVYLTLLTSMFMHGGFAHIAGNMLYLWIFGDNLEDRLGHMRYLLFYLVCGVLASLCHVFTTKFMDDNMLIPSLGASGAISGILGAYLLLFPRRRVTVILFRWVTHVTAVIAIGI